LHEKWFPQRFWCDRSLYVAEVNKNRASLVGHAVPNTAVSRGYTYYVYRYIHKHHQKLGITGMALPLCMKGNQYDQ
jgi:hypothetical protein